MDDDKTIGEGGVPLNVYETDGALVVVAPMPGVRPDDVEVSIRDNTLVLDAALRAEAGNRSYLVREWDYGGYHREMPLPEGFGAPITASLGNGMLAVSLQRGGVIGDGPLVVQPAPA